MIGLEGETLSCSLVIGLNKENWNKEQGHIWYFTTCYRFFPMLPTSPSSSSSPFSTLPLRRGTTHSRLNTLPPVSTTILDSDHTLRSLHFLFRCLSFFYFLILSSISYYLLQNYYSNCSIFLGIQRRAGAESGNNGLHRRAPGVHPWKFSSRWRLSIRNRIWALRVFFC